MTGNLELSDQDAQDLYHVLNYWLQGKPEPERFDRIDNLRERLLKVNVNEF